MSNCYYRQAYGLAKASKLMASLYPRRLPPPVELIGREQSVLFQSLRNPTMQPLEIGRDYAELSKLLL